VPGDRSIGSGSRTIFFPGFWMTDDKRLTYLEAYRLSEERLRSQLTAALASDQRAVQVASIAVATAAIMTTLSSQATVPMAHILGALFLIFASFLAAFAARPTDFYMPGAKFNDFELDLEEQRSFERVIRDMAKFNDKHSDDNDKRMKRSGWFLRWSYWFSVAGVMIALVPQMSVVNDFWQLLLGLFDK
jgi:hypothetical protein